MAESINTTKSLEKAGLSALHEILFYMPRAFKDYRNPVRLANQLVEGSDQLGIFTVSSKSYFDRTNRPTASPFPFRLDVELRDDSHQIVKTSIFGAVGPWKEIHPGDEVAVYGPVKRYGRFLYTGSEIVPQYLWGKIAPVYPAIRIKIPSERMHDLTRLALEDLHDAATMLAANAGLREEDLAKSSGFDKLSGFLKAVHNPSNPDEFKKAMKGAHEICKAETLEKARRVKSRNPSKESVILVNKDAHLNFKYFTPTNDQRNAMIDVLNDLRSPMPMRRLLSGDVGTGKSAAFMVPAAEAFRSGATVHIIAPNQPLVQQLVDDMKKFFPDIPVEKVTSIAKPKLASAVLIGTTALINYDIKNNIQPDLLIVDEQHKLSRDQRDSVCGPHTNVLESTATAIPRSMALITHGGMDVSMLRESPVKKNIVTSIVNTDETRKDAHAELREIVKNGGQIAIVYALVENTKDSELQNVTEAFAKWEKSFPGLVTMAHGKMKDAEKMAAIDEMKSGAKKVLISSTVIEVGLTIPELKGMLVVNADRHGASGLHQLRGRLSRLGGEGRMFLYLPNEVQEETMARMQMLVDEPDGFKLSAMDMEQRGFGDLSDDSEDQAGKTVLTLKNIKIKPSDFMPKEEIMKEVEIVEKPQKTLDLVAPKVEYVHKDDITVEVLAPTKRIFKF